MKNRFLLFCFCCIFQFPLIGQDLPQVGIMELSNISYLENSDKQVDTLQQLNLVIPVRNNSFPLLVWVGGGAWSYVDRHMEMDLARKFAENGIAVASIGHRLSSAVWRDSSQNKGVVHPAHINDLAAAFSWLYANAENYGYDPELIFVGGFSSGAHLAALLGTDQQYLNKYNLSADQIRGLIPISGAYDIPAYHAVFLNGSRPNLAEEHVEAVFGSTIEQMENASPGNYLDGLNTPILLISDNNTYNYTGIFEAQIQESGFRDFQVLHIQELSHGDLWRNLSYDEESIIRDYIIAFIKQHS